MCLSPLSTAGRAFTYMTLLTASLPLKTTLWLLLTLTIVVNFVQLELKKQRNAELRWKRQAPLVQPTLYLLPLRKSNRLSPSALPSRRWWWTQALPVNTTACPPRRTASPALLSNMATDVNAPYGYVISVTGTGSSVRRSVVEDAASVSGE